MARKPGREAGTRAGKKRKEEPYIPLGGVTGSI